ncbi:hypothetical protein BVRB_8g201630 isoform B [Beta vulgaris subsp. vulgaris]|uniref:Uncharacterized protein n=1 Tax=Beta vulgaris subsp. vulgaris TaxID=3555 RepID=A0A0J8B5T9_BETVV|nr:hypothetical protein BVRB_8g201630 isoform B [Beta vulgaris subsp. vulgaris]
MHVWSLLFILAARESDNNFTLFFFLSFLHPSDLFHPRERTKEESQKQNEKQREIRYLMMLSSPDLIQLLDLMPVSAISYSFPLQ